MTESPTRLPVSRSRGAGRSTDVAAAVRAAVLGAVDEHLHVVRQAWRVSETDSDELDLLHDERNWWVARRLGPEVVVWFHSDEVDAYDEFDRVLDEGRAAGQPWNEVAYEATA